MKNKKYKIPEDFNSVLYPDPIIYGGKVYKAEVSVINELQLQNSPVQIAALHRLNLSNAWPYPIINPLGHIIFSIFNQETSDDKLDLRLSVRDDMENMALKLSSSSPEETDYFLLANTDTDYEEQERIAKQIALAKDDDELRDLLIMELLYQAMINALDDWPPARILY